MFSSNTICHFLSSVPLLTILVPNGWFLSIIHGSEVDLFTATAPAHNEMCHLSQNVWDNVVLFDKNEIPDFVTNSDGKSMFTRSTPGFVINEYRDEGLSDPGDCCGYCEKIKRCAQYGTCCLDQYESFDSAQMATEQVR